MGSVTVMFALVMLYLGKLHAHEVAFSAAKTSHYGKGTIAFDVVYLNDRQGYNPKTGIFHAPCIGLYSFTYNFLSYPHHCVGVYLYKNKSIMSRSYACNKYGFANGGNTVILLLRRGDKVWLFNNAGYIYGGQYATFNGEMISSVANKDSADKSMIDVDNQAEPKVEFASDEIEDEMEK